MKLFGKTVEVYLGKFTYRTKCPKCDGYSFKENIDFNEPCGNCGFMLDMESIWYSGNYKHYKEVGQWEVSTIKYKKFGFTTKIEKEFKWIPFKGFSAVLNVKSPIRGIDSDIMIDAVGDIDLDTYMENYH